MTAETERTNGSGPAATGRGGALAGRTVALAVTGSIAAYKAVEVARLCIKAGAKVVPLMTSSATRFVGPVTLSGICGEATCLDMWDARFEGEMHVAIAERADVLVVVPATADVLARLASGRADDLVTATALCARGPVLVAPAMHPNMWGHPAVQRNVEELRRQGRVRFVGPVDGVVASGESGMGRMAEPAAIVGTIAEVLAGLTPARAASSGAVTSGAATVAATTSATPSGAAAGDLSGKRIVVTAGPTYEALDPVRFLGNRSSGKMGFAIAARAARRGARVVLIAGPVGIPTPQGVVRRDVESADDMRRALAEELGASLDGADALIMAAAVADFRPAEARPTKIKKASGEPSAIALVRNPDLLAEIGHARRGTSPVLVGFALETGDDAAVVAYARQKLASKKVDLVVANAAHESLGHATNRVSIVSEAGAEAFFLADKDEVADRLLDRVADRLRA